MEVIQRSKVKHAKWNFLFYSLSHYGVCTSFWKVFLSLPLIIFRCCFVYGCQFVVYTGGTANNSPIFCWYSLEDVYFNARMYQDKQRCIEKSTAGFCQIFQQMSHIRKFWKAICGEEDGYHSQKKTVTILENTEHFNSLSYKINKWLKHLGVER